MEALRPRRPLAALVLAAASLAVTVPAPAAAAARTPRTIPSPKLVGPASGVTIDALPKLEWRRVRAADHYDWQISGGTGFNAVVASGNTKNVVATPTTLLPDGQYQWRLRTVDSDGNISSWTRPRAIRKLWASAPQVLRPANGAVLSFPTIPAVLMWAPVPHAVKYRVSVATDPAMSSLLNNGQPVETVATNLALNGTLASGGYYWKVAPVDAEGHVGASSSMQTFTWIWPTNTTTRVSDVSTDVGFHVPQFAWDPVPGAAAYQVEINSSGGWSPDAKVCCTDNVIATSYTPTTTYPNNTYYWRVRALDQDGHVGDWNVGPEFAKTFDDLQPAAIPNLHLRDNVDDTHLAQMTSTGSPVVAWDRVAGAVSYQVQVAAYQNVSGTVTCDWRSPIDRTTAAPHYAPWAAAGRLASYPQIGVNAEGGLSDATSYCVRVRALSNANVVGVWTQLFGPGQPAFRFSTGVYRDAAVLDGGQYIGPLGGAVTDATPLFTWHPVLGAVAYYVLVAKDPSFTTVIDETFVNQPSYSVRTPYPDETTSYYWAVVPVNSGNVPLGSDVATDHYPQSFQKPSTPPGIIGPGPGAVLTEQPVFRWGSVPGAARYQLEIADTPSFGHVLEGVLTDGVSYTATKTFAGEAVYWHVRAVDGSGKAGVWSPALAFARRFPAPTAQLFDPATGYNALTGDSPPVWTWSQVPGAVSYDVRLTGPDGVVHDFPGQRAPAGSFVTYYGVGSFVGTVRANFPNGASSPYTAQSTFTHTIGEVQAPRVSAKPGRIVFSWNEKPFTKKYRLQVSTKPDFSAVFDDATTEGTFYAPGDPLGGGYGDGGRLYWRIAATDAGDQQGDWSTHVVRMAMRLQVGLTGVPAKRQRGTVTVTVLDARNRPVKKVAVKLTGCGTKTRTARTTKKGVAVFKVTPRRAGALVATASRAGYRVSTATAIVS